MKKVILTSCTSKEKQDQFTAAELLNEFIDSSIYEDVLLVHKDDLKSDFSEWLNNK